MAKLKQRYCEECTEYHNQQDMYGSGNKWYCKECHSNRFWGRVVLWVFILLALIIFL